MAMKTTRGKRAASSCARRLLPLRAPPSKRVIVLRCLAMPEIDDEFDSWSEEAKSRQPTFPAGSRDESSPTLPSRSTRIDMGLVGLLTYASPNRSGLPKAACLSGLLALILSVHSGGAMPDSHRLPIRTKLFRFIGGGSPKVKEARRRFGRNGRIFSEGVAAGDVGILNLLDSTQLLDFIKREKRQKQCISP